MEFFHHANNASFHVWMEIRLIFIYFQVVLLLCTFFLRSAASTRSHSRFPIMIFLSACIGSLRSRYFVFVNEKRAVTGIETLGLTITKIRVKLKLNRGYVDLNSELNLFYFVCILLRHRAKVWTACRCRPESRRKLCSFNMPRDECYAFIFILPTSIMWTKEMRDHYLSR